MDDEEQMIMKNGRPATKGTCSVCGTKMFKIGGGPSSSTSKSAKKSAKKPAKKSAKKSAKKPAKKPAKSKSSKGKKR